MSKKSMQKGRGIEVDTESVNVLRMVRDEEAFHFYAALGQPTGEAARSLPDFLEKIKSVKLESLAFHLERKDIQNWVETTLGDSKLARQIGRIHPSHGDRARTKICTTIENRIKELTQAPSTLCVSEDLAVNIPSAMH
jgi:hypothetical protein